jgi:hypothetical protein
VADRVVFLRPDAERIARAVRTVEVGNRNETPLRFRRVDSGGGGGGRAFRICTFTGNWAIDTLKTVTFRGVTATPNAVVAVNLFANISGITATSVPCAIGKDGTAWYLIAARCP